MPSGGVVLMTGNGLSPSTMELFPLIGGQVISSTSVLPGSGNASYNVWAHYSGDATYASSDSSTVPVTVSPEPSTTTLSVLTFDANGNQLNFSGGPFGSFVYLRADVAGQSGFGIPTGNVTFLDNGSPIVGGSSLLLNGQGNTATPNGIFNFDTGSHSVSASYGGDPSFNASISTQSVSFAIQPGFFAAIQSNQSTVTISAPGSSGSTSVSVSSSTGFSGTITLACSGLPAGAACQFSPASIKATGTPTTTSSAITVTTSSGTAAMLQPSAHPSLGGWLTAGSLMLFSIVLIGGPRRRRRRPPFLVATVALILLAPGCGGGGSSTPPPPPPTPATVAGTYNILVTASSGSISSTSAFTLFVQ